MTEQYPLTLEFDVDGHEINAHTLATCVRSIKIIFEEVSRLAHPKTKPEILVKPPEEGSYKVIFTIAIAILAQPIRDFTSEFIRGAAQEWSGVEEPYQNLGRDFAHSLTKATAGITTTPMHTLEKFANEHHQKKNKKRINKILRAKNDLYRTCGTDNRVEGIKIYCNTQKHISEELFSEHCSQKYNLRNKKKISEKAEWTTR